MRPIRSVDFDEITELKSIFEEDGFVVVDECPDEFDVMNDRIGGICEVVDRLSPEKRPTKISSDGEGRVGLGYTNSALFPHTDRSGTERPPRALFFVMHRPCPIGGDSLLVHGDDGRSRSKTSPRAPPP